MKTSHLHRPSLRSARAFTLVELLVTVTIIIVIAALSFSGFSRMRKSGDRAAAMRNLSQLQLANISYAQDHGGQFVPVSEFNDTGGAYVAWMDNPKFLAMLKGDAASYYADGRVDKTTPNVNYAARFRWQGAEAVEGASTNQKIAYRHHDKALVVFYDGHTEEISMADMRRFDALGGSNHPFWKGDAP